MRQSGCNATQKDWRARGTWHGSERQCGHVLHSAYNGTFHGTFARERNFTALRVYGDSIAGQLLQALSDAQEVNPHLSGLRLLPSRLGVEQIPVIPSTVAGCRGMLEHHLHWPADARQRVLVLSFGAWYNLDRHCEIFETANICHATRKVAEPQHDQAAQFRPAPPGGGCSQWGGYAYARRATSSLTIEHWMHDVRMLIDALDDWQRDGQPGQNVSVFWLESPPGHFVPPGSDCKADRPGYAHASCEANGCASEPVPPLAKLVLVPTQVSRLSNDSEIPAECRSGDGVNAPLWRLTPFSSLPAACRRFLGDWRNQLASPAMRDAGIDVLPIAAALLARAELHTGAVDRTFLTRDCLHWCRTSDATDHLAMGALSVISSRLAEAFAM